MEEQITTASLAFLFGALHAIEPGHGKTALFTYLANGKSTWKDGVAIALSSSFTHTVVVLVIALVSHGLITHVGHNHDHFILDGLRYVSASIICGLGLYFFFKKTPSSCSHCESHGHSHDHEHTHRQEGKKKSLIASGMLGFATGLVPCPSVVVAYLSGVSSGNSIMGLKLVIWFALGMALSLVSLVFLFTFGSKKLSGKLDKVSFNFNWNRVQGSVFFVIGLFTFFYH